MTEMTLTEQMKAKKIMEQIKTKEIMEQMKVKEITEQMKAKEIILWSRNNSFWIMNQLPLTTTNPSIGKEDLCRAINTNSCNNYSCLISQDRIPST